MVMCAYGIQRGTNTVGDLVMINTMMIQLYQPLNFMGMVYREIKQAVIDIEMMFAILACEPEIKDRPGARPLEVTRGVIGSITSPSRTSRSAKSSRGLPSRCLPATPWPWSGHPAPASQPSRACCFAFTR